MKWGPSMNKYQEDFWPEQPAETNLDAKLGQILRLNISPTFTYSDQLQAIKQTFQEEGFCAHTRPMPGAHLMSGKEWLDRFEKELKGENFGDVEGQPVYVEKYVLRAARRAAGVEK